MGRNATNSVFSVSDKVRLKSVSSATETRNFACSKFIYNTFYKANNKGADQSVRMRRLVCAFVHKPQKTGFFTSRPIKIYCT